MKVLIIINDAPYGSEKAYNALRLAMMLQHDHKDAAVRLFLLGDAVTSALAGQQTPQGYYNVERMLSDTIKGGAEVLLCRTCSTARGIADLRLVEGARVGTMADLGRRVVESDRVLTF
jgi:uncharacterized protein involved in oxidation of intracellular sulfur